MIADSMVKTHLRIQICRIQVHNVQLLVLDRWMQDHFRAAVHSRMAVSFVARKQGEKQNMHLRSEIAAMQVPPNPFAPNIGTLDSRVTCIDGLLPLKQE
jgi:hypothetical protein